MSKIKPDLLDIIEDVNQIDTFLAELIDEQAHGEELCKKINGFEKQVLVPAETDYKTAFRREKGKFEDLADIIAEQPKAEVERRNRSPYGWMGVSDNQRRELEEAARRITPEETQLEAMKSRRVRLPSEKLDALKTAFSPLRDEANEYEKYIAVLFDKLTKCAGELRDHLDETAQHKNRSFSFVNQAGINSRINHLDAGDLLGGNGPM